MLFPTTPHMAIECDRAAIDVGTHDIFKADAIARSMRRPGDSGARLLVQWVGPWRRGCSANVALPWALLGLASYPS